MFMAILYSIIGVGVLFVLYIWAKEQQCFSSDTNSVNHNTTVV
jgi:hypothetical protein